MDLNELVWIKNKDPKDTNRLWNNARITSKVGTSLRGGKFAVA